MTLFTVAAFNYEAGGHVPGHGFDMRPLQQQFAELAEPPALVLFCEAKDYGANAGEGLHAAAAALAEQLHVPYVGLLGHPNWGKLAPAIFYNPTILQLQSWPARDEPDVYPDRRNVATFTVRDTGRRFLAWAAHWNAQSGAERRIEAGYLDRYGEAHLPVIGGGDLNCVASGPHMPRRDWAGTNFRTRSHKAVFRNGVWVPDTDAIDHLIGRWDPGTNDRVEGCGYHAVAELCWRETGYGMEPTIVDKPGEGDALLIDYLIVNAAMRTHVIAEQYRVHPQPAGYPPPSDHLLITVPVDL